MINLPSTTICDATLKQEHAALQNEIKYSAVQSVECANQSLCTMMHHIKKPDFVVLQNTNCACHSNFVWFMNHWCCMKTQIKMNQTCSAQTILQCGKHPALKKYKLTLPKFTTWWYNIQHHPLIRIYKIEAKSILSGCCQGKGTLMMYVTTKIHLTDVHSNLADAQMSETQRRLWTSLARERCRHRLLLAPKVDINLDVAASGVDVRVHTSGQVACCVVGSMSQAMGSTGDASGLLVKTGEEAQGVNWTS